MGNWVSHPTSNRHKEEEETMDQDIKAYIYKTYSSVQNGCNMSNMNMLNMLKNMLNQIFGYVQYSDFKGRKSRNNLCKFVD